MDSPMQILVASSELESRRALSTILNKEGYDTMTASRLSECQEALAGQNVKLIFCDKRLADGSYKDLLAITRAFKNPVRVVVTSRLADWDEYLEALHHGAFDLIASPCQPTDVLWSIIQARREDHEKAGFVQSQRTRAVAAGRMSA
jgi:DNA-binding NtrC family response regulator